MNRDIIVLLLFIAIPLGIYFAYSGISKSDKLIDYQINEFINCKNAPEPVQEFLENLSSYLNGIFYNKRILLCTEYNNKIYCLQSNKITVNNLSIIYFDNICYTQKTIEENLPFILVPYGMNISDAKFSDKSLKEAIFS